MAYVYHEYVDGFRCFRVKIKSYGNFEHCLTFISVRGISLCYFVYKAFVVLTATGTV